MKICLLARDKAKCMILLNSGMLYASGFLFLFLFSIEFGWIKVLETKKEFHSVPETT